MDHLLWITEATYTLETLFENQRCPAFLFLGPQSSLLGPQQRKTAFLTSVAIFEKKRTRSLFPAHVARPFRNVLQQETN